MMTQELVDRIAETVLYEGYLLYPYCASAVKNQQRFNFGVLEPQEIAESDRSRLHTECLVCGESPLVRARIRFLHLVHRQVREQDGTTVDFLEVDGERYQTWTEAVDREVGTPELSLAELLTVPKQLDFAFDEEESTEAILNGCGQSAGSLVRTRRQVRGTISLQAFPVDETVFRLRVTIVNVTPVVSLPDDREATLLHSLVSTHAVLTAINGAFASLLEPPEELTAAAAACRQIGCWPVLAGREGDRTTVLASPIILYDYPQVAEESPGDFFDGAEIDEMLSLRVLTMTPKEHREMCSVDERARQLLERTRTLPTDHLLKLHGTMRSLRPAEDAPLLHDSADWLAHDLFLQELQTGAPVESVRVEDVDLRAGDKVRLRPRRRADIMDMALQDKVAAIEAIEQDFEGKIYLAVVLDDDPGRDLGWQRQPGHRFFFAPDEVEPLTLESSRKDEP